MFSGGDVEVGSMLVYNYFLFFSNSCKLNIRISVPYHMFQFLITLLILYIYNIYITAKVLLLRNCKFVT